MVRREKRRKGRSLLKRKGSEKKLVMSNRDFGKDAVHRAGGPWKACESLTSRGGEKQERGDYRFSLTVRKKLGLVAQEEKGLRE